VSHADADVQAAARVFHQGPEEPRVQHLLGLDLRAKVTGRPIEASHEGTVVHEA
jgi:hypothetical protein